jgi:hypothetical protein
MRVRRVAGGLITGTAALTGVLLLAGPASADDPTPDPTPITIDDGGLIDPGDGGQCFFVTPGPDETPVEETEEPAPDPSDVVTAEPGETVTPEPGVTEEPATEVTEEPAAEVTDEPTPDVTDEPTPDVTDEPTPDVTDVPTPEPTGSYVCLAYTDGPLASGSGATGGAGEASGDATGELPFGGAPLGQYLATGLGLLLAGTGTVLVARRRTS